jgi:hypothetical protein
VFTDGNATAFNYNFAHTISGCVFSNMYQIEEFYLKYPTNAASYFVNNYAVNIQHSFVALNGGTYTNEPYVISNNIFYQNGGNGIGTCPATSLTIVSNQFICNPGNYNICIVLGEAGYQGYSDNSNIVISGNSFVSPSVVIEIAGGTSSNDPTRVENVQFYGNTITRSDSGVSLITDYNWANKIFVFSNNISGVTGGNVTLTSGAFGSPYALVDTNNQYFTHVATWASATNVISYAGGSKWEYTDAYYGNALYTLSDIDSNQIPVGAQIVITNATFNASAVPVYLNSAATAGPVILPYQQSQPFFWNGSAWVTNIVSMHPAPPYGLHIIN